MWLKNSQKNHLFDIIVKSKLSPSLFVLVEKEMERYGYYTTISLRDNKKYYFNIWEDSIVMCPGFHKLTESHDIQSFSGSSVIFDTWISFLAEELSTPDKWELIEKQIQQLNFNPNFENLTFSHNEYIDLSGKLDLLKDKLIERLELDESNSRVLNQLLDHQKEMMKNLNKRDWMFLFIGGFFTYFQNLALNAIIHPDQIPALFSLIKLILKGYFLN